MGDILRLAKEIFDAQAFTQFLHAELYHADKSSVEIRLPITPELLQQHGFVHGGVLSYLADNAITFAGGMALGGDALTSEFKINYIKPAKGNYLSAHAKAISAGNRFASAKLKLLRMGRFYCVLLLKVQS
ncbi:PaaI family thioesterase [uncultured Microbulbifer sp.]|uniref:PaaI family thioesterase n=1 Tax=uncultured Microbulbifer sp. TaxID=348147 RepID=UPI0026053662|nr:PaaI family thioesterase [uncultured Microbulbifer sp.]